MTDSENPRRSGDILGTGDAYPTAGDPGLVREDSGTGDEFATLLRSDFEKYADVVKRAKLNME